MLALKIQGSPNGSEKVALNWSSVFFHTNSPAGALRRSLFFFLVVGVFFAGLCLTWFGYGGFFNARNAGGRLNFVLSGPLNYFEMASGCLLSLPNLPISNGFLEKFWVWQHPLSLQAFCFWSLFFIAPVASACYFLGLYLSRTVCRL